jgi:hypothetical protein
VAATRRGGGQHRDDQQAEQAVGKQGAYVGPAELLLGEQRGHHDGDHGDEAEDGERHR